MICILLVVLLEVSWKFNIEVEAIHLNSNGQPLPHADTIYNNLSKFYKFVPLYKQILANILFLIKFVVVHLEKFTRNKSFNVLIKQRIALTFTARQWPTDQIPDRLTSWWSDHSSFISWGYKYRWPNDMQGEMNTA